MLGEVSPVSRKIMESEGVVPKSELVSLNIKLIKIHLNRLQHVFATMVVRLFTHLNANTLFCLKENAGIIDNQ